MKYQHPTIAIETPAAGHYVIKGHNPRSVFIEGEGTLVPPLECYISPEVPSELLRAILEDRESASEAEPEKRGRKAKEAAAPVEAQAEASETEDFK